MRYHVPMLRMLFVALALLTFVTVALSQEETAATMTGVVTDAAGSVVQGANVTVTNKDTNAERKVETNADGNYVVTPLTPGSYTIVAWHEKLGTQDQKVTIGEKESKDTAFTFKAPAEAPASD